MEMRSINVPNKPYRAMPDMQAASPDQVRGPDPGQRDRHTFVGATHGHRSSDAGPSTLIDSEKNNAQRFPSNTCAGGLRHRILHITPGWFAVNMGTGIASALLHTLPYNARWLRIVSTCIFVLNVVLFLVIGLLTVVRYIVWPRTFMVTLDHPMSSLLWGTLPMGLGTIVNMIILTCVPVWGQK
jgi:hypothetical protein